MREIIERIREQQTHYLKAPFFTFLRDPSVEPEKKLAFAPQVAHFVLTFADLCTLLLPQEPAPDRYQELVNANCREDQGHWRWFLTDLAQLERDPQLPFSRAIQAIWDDSTVRTRRLSYHLAHWSLACDSLGKLVLVHCIEGAFKATVKDLEPVALQFIQKTGKQLHYLGVRHAEAEESHTIEDTSVREFIQSIAVGAEAKATYFKMIDEAFVLFAGFTDEMLELAKSVSDGR
jgi:hypothetical protein